MGAVEENVLRQARLAGDPVPDRIANRPQLLPGLDFFLFAFYDLSTERQAGMGVMPIPWSAMHGYALAHDMSGEDYEDLLYLVRALDTAYLKSLDKG